MLTAAVYARYSSSLQRPTSVADQVSRCREAAARFGCDVADERVYADEELSGAMAQRPAYQRLMEAAKRREFDAIIVEAQDRLWRDQAEMHAALRRLRFWGVRVFSVETAGDLTDKTGGIVAAVMGWRDEAFLDSLAGKTRRGMAGQVSRKMSAGGRAYGYRSVPIYDETSADAYGQAVILGYRKVIDEAETKVVRRIFEMYSSGLSSKTIAHRLNAERIPPPRPKRGRTANGWTWTTISGSRRKGIGILNNEAYRGIFYWNRSAKSREPESGRRITRARPREEWLRVEIPELRIIPDDLWNKVKARQREIEKQARGQKGGCRNTPHLFSGLLRCGVCGASYTQRDRRHLACSFHRNRGPLVCPNGKVVRREELERRLLAVIQEEILSAENVAYLARKVSEALERANSRSRSARPGLEAELRKAERELEYIRQAVRLGKATVPLLEMLEEATAKIQRLRTELGVEPKAKAIVKVLPGLVERYARDLRATLGRDTDRARLMLSRLLGDVILRPEKDGLWAEMRGDLRALLEGAGYVDSVGAGRGI